MNASRLFPRQTNNSSDTGPGSSTSATQESGSSGTASATNGPTGGSSDGEPSGTSSSSTSTSSNDSSPLATSGSPSSSSTSTASFTTSTSSSSTDTSSSTSTSTSSSLSSLSTQTTTSTSTTATFVSSPTTSTSMTVNSATSTTAFDAALSNSSSLQTTSLTTITTSINGQLTTLTTPIPTSLSTESASQSNANRTAIIGGTTAAAVVLVILAIAVVFVYKRAQKRRLGFIEALRRGTREGKGAGGVGLLDGEFDDEEEVPMAQYRDSPGQRDSIINSRSTSRLTNITPTRLANATPMAAAKTPTPTTSSPTPSLYRSRASDSGSIFHEAVWPPPGQESRFVDPFTGKFGGENDDLSKIVDDVMGPSSSSGDLPAPPPGAMVVAPPTASINDDDDRGRKISEKTFSSSSTGSVYNDPFRDLSHSPKKPSVYYDGHSREGSHASTASSVTLSQPKKPSPLASNVLTNSKNQAWLARTPRSLHAKDDVFQ